MSGWTHAMCEACWIEEEGLWEREADGTEILGSVRRPTLMREPEVERCCFCGLPTIFGLYVRRDPEVMRSGWCAHKDPDEEKGQGSS